MGQRSRKRGRRETARERNRQAAARAPARSPSPARSPAPSRSELRNAEVRAALRPLEPGERPWPLSVSAAVCVILALANLVLFFAGTKPHVGGAQPKLGEIIVFSGLMLLCAGGMWRLRYWAVLGFMTLLAIGLLGFSLALISVSNLCWGLVCAVVDRGRRVPVLKLVRVLSRLQMPKYPGR